MSATTGPILATGAITLVNQTLFNQQDINWRIPIATGMLAGAMSLAERVWPTGAKILAWTGLVTVLMTRIDPNEPSPAENALSWWQKG